MSGTIAHSKFIRVLHGDSFAQHLAYRCCGKFPDPDRYSQLFDPKHFFIEVGHDFEVTDGWIKNLEVNLHERYRALALVVVDKSLYRSFDEAGSSSEWLRFCNLNGHNERPDHYQQEDVYSRYFDFQAVFRSCLYSHTVVRDIHAGYSPFAVKIHKLKTKQEKECLLSSGTK